MSGALTALLGALIGAASGLAGGAFAALASLRASQIAARAPLPAKIHTVATRIVKLRASLGTGEENENRMEFNVAWNDLAAHTKILCPSRRIEELLGLILAIQKKPPSSKEEADAHVGLASETLGRITDMIAAHSHYLRHSRAISEEKRILDQWVEDEDSFPSVDLRKQIRAVNRGNG